MDDNTYMKVDELKVILTIIANPGKLKNPNQVATECKSTNPKKIYDALDRLKPFIKYEKGYKIDKEKIEQEYDSAFPVEKRQDFFNMLEHPFLANVMRENLDSVISILKQKDKQKMFIDIHRDIKYKKQDAVNLKEALNL